MTYIINLWHFSDYTILSIYQNYELPYLDLPHFMFIRKSSI